MHPGRLFWSCSCCYPLQIRVLSNDWCTTGKDAVNITACMGYDVYLELFTAAGLEKEKYAC